MKYLASALAASMIALAGGASAAVVDVVQSPTGYFVPDAASTYDSPYYRWANDDWGWTHNAITEPFTTATLQISAFDVDFDFGERDAIYAYDNGTQVFLGYLAGANDIYSYTEFTLGSEFFDDIAGGLQLWMDIDTGFGGWAVTLAKSVITTDGAAPPPPDPGAVVPLPAALPLIGSALAGLFGAGALRRRRG